ncbi:NUDIX hydrolase [Streptomyces sp. NPDC004609]|uniref:NUDIX hydrolase n=1 Tax=Streptomyces sp. NPDC004609 TaxID=3364704 RepID=UPI0036A1E0C0
MRTGEDTYSGVCEAEVHNSQAYGEAAPDGGSRRDREPPGGGGPSGRQGDRPGPRGGVRTALDGAPAAPAPLPASELAAVPVSAPVPVSVDGLPEWLDPVVRVRDTIRPAQLSRFLPPPTGGRQSAVLVLFGEGTTGPELLLMERASSLRSHAGQPAFPGGALDPEDGDPATTGPLRAALREAEEETGLDPSGVQIFGALPKLYIPVSSFVVTPVLGWWRAPSPVGAVDPAETARVFTVPVADLTDPANRAMTAHPSGHLGPAFTVEGALVWGFTAGVIDRILHYAGWEQPWDRGKQVPLDWRA